MTTRSLMAAVVIAGAALMVANGAKAESMQYPDWSGYSIGRWIDEKKPVVIATRCPTGVVTPLYALEGGGSRLAAMGTIPAGPRSPSQARMELMIALSAGVAYGS